jgi:serine-type D-Ala-D-Ala carboxypeptidase
LPDHTPLSNSPNIAGQGLAPAYEEQGRRFATALSLLRKGVAERIFPAAAVGVTYKGNLICLKAVGRFTYEAESPEVTAEGIFDLASLTKVIATTSAAMLLFDHDKLDLEMPVVKIVPEISTGDARRERITFRMLLAHSSGLPAYEKLFLQAHGRDELIASACAAPLVVDPGSKAEYSDIGFIILGLALERLAGESLDKFTRQAVFLPLGMAHTGFDPPVHWWSFIPPTQDDRQFRHRVIQGEVQDENASVMGGVAGHAGLFGPAEDLARFAHMMLRGGKPLFQRETVAFFTQRQSSPAGTSRTLGWDTPSAPSQSGRHFSPRSFGHLGYTGTSLWIDPEVELSITLLTNRTWPDCKNEAIRQFRPKFHDAVVEGLETGE